jgi:hypothetical protein
MTRAAGLATIVILGLVLLLVFVLIADVIDIRRAGQLLPLLRLRGSSGNRGQT